MKQEVICIEDRYWIGINKNNSLGNNGPRKGKVYTVTARFQFFGRIYLELAEFDPTFAFHSKYFAPLISDEQLHEELAEILNPIEV